jgi:hypothetical protein
MLLCSYVKNNNLVVKNNSSVQIYDLINGRQFFEMKMQSCRKMFLLD